MTIVHPQGSALGPVLLNIFSSDTDSQIECILSKSADNTNLCGAVNTQRELDRFEKWSCASPVKFNKAKCKILHPGWCNPKRKYRPGRECALEEEDLGFLVDKKKARLRAAGSS
ncbi:rna-directed dna polymerase from mobile element jockey-like [Willisornis vidua]|uniref:Rna-directed dna polymerase from mobile element jockey-like n=1 Tax=Willisornis vidua TaxID=1566151 RepID=A0ABQ9CQG4_9PASS|nr:rna-directed dna polymerase from mobile element jockey-like [Willisornis vidua]